MGREGKLSRIKRDSFWPGEPTRPYIFSLPGPGGCRQRKSELEMQRHGFVSVSKATLGLFLSLSLNFVVNKIGIMTFTLSASVELFVKLEEGK